MILAIAVGDGIYPRALSVRAARHPRVMWLAHVVCSGRDCYEELEIVADRLEEIDRVTCECGHGFVLLTISEVELVTP
ncbi:MAG: hypothetical protein GEU88_07735 [Solirubrobacterales bacterium]|nr:hypothetical protein [Solirubrobacterales bacterium]